MARRLARESVKRTSSAHYTGETPVPLQNNMTRAVYDDIAPRYDAAMRPLERWFLSRWRAETMAHLSRDSHILEVGAGTGLNFRFYPASAHGVASGHSPKCKGTRRAGHSHRRTSGGKAESAPTADF